MRPFKLLVVASIALAAISAAQAAEPYTLHIVQGSVVKFEKDVLTVQPADAKGKPVTLHITGTSKVSLAGTQSRESKMYMTQRDTEAKSLEEKQKITAIYALLGSDPILLTAVVQADDKAEPVKADPAKTDPAKKDAAKPDPTNPVKKDAPKSDPVKPDPKK